MRKVKHSTGKTIKIPFEKICLAYKEKIRRGEDILPIDIGPLDICPICGRVHSLMPPGTHPAKPDVSSEPEQETAME